MPNIIVACYPLAEHYAGAFQIAERLKLLGYNLVFIDISDEFEDRVLSMGFEFEIIHGDPSLSPFLMDKDNDVITRVGRLFRPVKESDVSFYVNGYDALIERFKPAVIVLDCRLIENAILLRRYEVPILAFQTLICPNKIPGLPPLNSRYVPGAGMLSYLKAEYLWLRFFWRKIRNRIIDTMHDRNQGLVRYAVLKKLAELIDYPLAANIDRRRFLNIGLKNVPEFIVYPYELDFPHEIPVNHFYIGYGGDNRYDEEHAYPEIIQFIDKIREGHARPVIGCILGHSGDVQFEAYKGDLRKMLQAFERKSGYDFIIFLGNDITPDFFEPIPSNIHFVHYLELSLNVSIVKRLDMLITHGDMKGINNAVLAGTPMLVFSRYNGNDQNGNAARVVYHGLGEMGRLGADTVQEIMERIEHVLQPACKSRVVAMRDRIRDSAYALSGDKALRFFMETVEGSFVRSLEETTCDSI